MSYRSLALAALAAWVVDIIYGYVVYSVLLAGQFTSYGAIYRSPGTEKLPVLFAAILVAVLVLAWIFAKGHEGGNGTTEGLRFGLAVGLLFASIAVVNYATMNIGRRFTLTTGAASFVEAVVIGLVLGATYKPARAGAATAGRGGAV